MQWGVAAHLYGSGTQGWRVRAVTAALICVALTAFAAPVFAVDAPHVPTDVQTDACAMCHRTHTAASDTTWSVAARPAETTHTALILGTYEGVGDTELCFTCHGVDALGSSIDVQTSATSESSHTLMPYSSAYGPAAKQCSSCHDSHGSDRDLLGNTYAALLRSRSTTDPLVTFFGGDAYCASCHQDRPADTWDGLAVWQQTAHAKEMTATSDTGIICSACHDPHGSNNPPTIVESLVPPAVAATTSVAANDRAFCFKCHPSSSYTFSGQTTYQTSVHAASLATVTAVGEWASDADVRRVGECQNCHAPMGSSDGAGGVVPKLTEVAGRALCDRCHSAISEVSQIASDLAQFKFPATQTTRLEVAVATNAERLSSAMDRLALYAQETTGTLPNALIGPREYDLPGAAGDMAYGDIQGDGTQDLVIADSSAKRLVVFSPNALKGVSSASYSIGSTPTMVAVADVFIDTTARPEIVVVAGSSVASSTLSVYRYNGSGLDALVTGLNVGQGASGIAAGALSGTGAAEVVVTTATDNSMRILTESTVTSDTFAAATVVGTLQGPRGPSIGNADSTKAGNEIVIANSLEAVNNVSVFNSAGGARSDYAASITAGASAWDTLVADVLPGTIGAEMVVALRSTVDTSGVNVFELYATGSDATPLSYATGRYYATSSLTSGDVDADASSRSELVVGNAGTWALDNTTRRAPSVQVFAADAAGTSLLSPTTYSAGGVEQAGNTPAVVAVDLGAVGQTRHPTSVVTGAHVSTETAIAVRHVECVDCHNVHEATSTVSAVAPDVYGHLKGSWGVTASGVDVRPVVYEYQTCYKCHRGTAGDAASTLATTNASFHPVVGASSTAQNTAGSFVTGWSLASRTYCKDCHGNSVPGKPSGPHASEAAPLLSRPLWGDAPSDSNGLCYTCHKYSVYYTGVDDRVAGSTSNFYDASSATSKLHFLHTNQKGFRCDACHSGHGSADQHMIEPGLDWVHADTGGACYTSCHGGTTANAYSRTAGDVTATSFQVLVGSVGATQVADIATQDGTNLTVAEVNGTPGFDVELNFSGLTATPSNMRFFGRYDGNVGHVVRVEAWNYVTSAWVSLGTWPTSATATTYTFPMASAAYLSGGQSRLRVYHASPGNATHSLIVDRAWLRY